jgi:hypothetical protein
MFNFLSFKFHARSFACACLLLLAIGLNVVFVTACESKTLDRRASRALAAVDEVLAVLPPDAPGVAEVKQFRANLQAFQVAVQAADTPAKQAQAVIQFATLISAFNATVKPFIPADSPAGVKLAQADRALKNLSAKIACLLVVNLPRKVPDEPKAAAEYVALTRAQTVITAYANS